MYLGTESRIFLVKLVKYIFGYAQYDHDLGQGHSRGVIDNNLMW